MAEARTSLRRTSAARSPAAPSFLSAGAAPPSAVRLAGPAAPHGPRRPPRSPLPRSRPGSHGRSEQRKELRLRRQTGDWARPRGAIAAKRERPELPPLTPAGTSPAAHPAPGAAELRRYLQPSERAGEPAPLPRNSPKLRGCRPPGAGGKVRARGAQTGRRTRGPSERTAVGGLSEPLRLPSAIGGRLS